MQPTNVNQNVDASKLTSRESDVQWIAQEAPHYVRTFWGTSLDGLREMDEENFRNVVAYVEATVARSYAVTRMREAIMREVPTMDFCDADDFAEQIVPWPSVPERS